MQAAILYSLRGDPSVDELPEDLDGGLPAATASRTEYLDGRVIHDGTLAGRIDEDVRVPVVTDEAIVTETETRPRAVKTEYVADLDGGWAGVDSSDGERLLADYLSARAGVIPEAVELDLEGFAESLPDDVETNGIVYSQSIDEGHGRDAAGSLWKRDAKPHKIPTEGVSALAVTYTWDGMLVEAMLAASGYVAVYRHWGAETFARWVAAEIEPFLDVETETPSQQTLDTETCDDCGRESENLEPHGDEMLCPVCLNGRIEEVTS